MHKRFGIGAAVLPLLLLVGCNEDSGGDAPPVVVTPTPSPTPTPTPTPTPVPVTYVDPFDFAQASPSFQSPMAETKFREIPDTTTPSGYRLDYSTAQLFETPLASLLWSVNIPRILDIKDAEFHYEHDGTGGFISTLIGAGHLVRKDENGFLLRWNTLGATRLEAEVERYTSAIKFVAGANFHSEIINSFKPGEAGAISSKFFLAGQRSDAIDVPASGVMLYSGKLKLSEVPQGIDDFVANSPSVSVNYSSGLVTGVWMVGSRRFELTGALRRDEFSRFEGTIRSDDGEFSGRFIGDSYGPDAREVGLLLSMSNADFAVAGSFIGTNGLTV